MKKFNELATQQYAMREWASEHIIYCVSTLINELEQRAGILDELFDAGIVTQDDWFSAAEYYIGSMTRQEVVDELAHHFDTQSYTHETDEELKIRLLKNLKPRGELEKFCDHYDIDPYSREALEHWIVSPWFAERLAEKGEMVNKNFLGLTIWGRQTTGQAIILDTVVKEIYDDVLNTKSEPHTNHERLGTRSMSKR